MSERIDYIRIDAIGPNPNNPRKHFDQAELEKLAQSIREVGMLQPVLAAINGLNGDFSGESEYYLIAGERRWRAAQLAGLEHIPVVLKKLTPEQEAEIMLIENLQRKDLDPIEEAAAYKALLDGHGYTQETLGGKLGVSQSHIANRIRLLELPETVQENISREIISPSHGRVLAGYKHLPAPTLKKAVEAIVEKHVPVAKTAEAIARVIAEEGKPLFDDYNIKPEFNIEPCEKCGFRVMWRRYGYDETEYPYCVKLSCWEKKQQEVRKAKEQALADRARKAAKKGQGVVELDKFQWDQYEAFLDYKIKDLDLSECQDCEHKKVAKGSYIDELTEACFLPSCFKKKQLAATREKNKQARDALQVELEGIAELAKNAADACNAISMPRQVLVYLAAQVLANIQNHYERKVTRYQYVKDKFGWDDGVFKSTAYHSLGSEWETFRTRLESLSDQKLWQIIIEWPAVAEGLTGIRKWMLEQGIAEEPEGCDTDEELGIHDDKKAPVKKIKSYTGSTKEIPLPTFAKRAGLSCDVVRKMAEKGEIKSVQSYRHRLIPESELDKVGAS